MLALLLALPALPACEGPAGKNGNPGAPGVTGVTGVTGPSGTAGGSCTVTANSDGTKTITCDDGTTVTVKDGQAGSSCTVTDNGDGTKTISCDDGTTVTVANGATGPTGNPGVAAASTGLKVAVTSVTTDAAGPIAVRFTLKDDRGYPVDKAGVYSVNAPLVFGFSLAYVTTDAAGNVLPYTVYSRYNSTSALTTFRPTWYNPSPSTSSTTKTPAIGTLVENGVGQGDYTYTFPTADVAQTDLAGTANGVLYKAVAYDSAHLSDTHSLWIQATRQTDLVNATNPRTFSVVNYEHVYIPSGSGTPIKREIAKTANCDNCHRGFKPEGSTANAFHGGRMVDARFCGVCHNPARTTNPAAEAMVFVHRIHNSEHLQPANLFHGIEATYPQDIRNCDGCHKGAAQGAQADARPSRAACGSCHDYVQFDASAAASCTKPRATDANGLNLPCNHTGGAQTADTACKGCHSATAIAGYHKPVAPPDPNNAWNGGTNSNTNAAYLAAAGFVPTGAQVITYDVKSVSTWTDTAVTPNVKRPQIEFKLKADGADVVFQTYAAGSVTEIMPNFVGSPSVYFAWAVPQDGVNAPVDFNVTASGYIKKIWDGTATTTGAGTIAGPDATGYYTIKLTGVVVPDSATMLTGGVGYSYSLASAPPLTQTNVTGYAYNTTTKQGGLIVPAPDVWKVATSFTGRRAIVDNAKCNACHAPLGVAPTFHAGQRNDGPTCSFCHNPNRTSSGWSANSKDIMHGIHAGRMRTTDFTWHASQPGRGYGDVTFPSPLNDCESCHKPGTYDFSATASATALPDLLPSYVATGRFRGDPAINPTGYFSLSPYVAADNSDYGFGFATSDVKVTLPDGNGGTQGATTCTVAAPCYCTAANPCTVTSTVGKQGATTCTAAAPCTCTTAATCSVTVKTCTTKAPCQADGSTLVSTPITAACASCHNGDMALDHMMSNGGHFYDTRANVLAPGAHQEQCMLCHGPGKIAAIGDVHK
ncbi:MAG TPA: OmcA/MtrC family decaheme c-type cytochrome [Polyangia bacterium]